MGPAGAVAGGGGQPSGRGGDGGGVGGGPAIVDELVATDRLPGSHLVPTVRGELLTRLGRHREARTELELAARLCTNERSVLLAKLAAPD